MKARLTWNRNGKRNLRYNLSRRVELERWGRVGGGKSDKQGNCSVMGLRIKVHYLKG